MNIPRMINNTGRTIEAGELISAVPLTGGDEAEYEIVELDGSLLCRPIVGDDDTILEEAES